jgi:nitrogenase iron protein NifH
MHVAPETNGRMRIAIYGKGGIGKSTITASLSVVYALAGKSVLHVGCDPKQDSTLKLGPIRVVPSVLDAYLREGKGLTLDHIVGRARHGIDFIEAGGPEPAAGCAGRGVSLVFELLEQLELFRRRRYDVVLYDVLGDVVCGGFAAAFRRGAAELVYVVTSEEVMSLYAANNIARGVASHARNGTRLGGLILNLRDAAFPRPPLEEFAARLGTRIVGAVDPDPLVRRAERALKTVVELAPDAPIVAKLRELAATLEQASQQPPPPPPTPLVPREFNRFVEERLAVLDAEAEEDAG